MKTKNTTIISAFVSILFLCSCTQQEELIDTYYTPDVKWGTYNVSGSTMTSFSSSGVPTNGSGSGGFLIRYDDRYVLLDDNKEILHGQWDGDDFLKHDDQDTSVSLSYGFDYGIGVMFHNSVSLTGSLRSDDSIEEYAPAVWSHFASSSSKSGNTRMFLPGGVAFVPYSQNGNAIHFGGLDSNYYVITAGDKGYGYGFTKKLYVVEGWPTFNNDASVNWSFLSESDRYIEYHLHDDGFLYSDGNKVAMVNLLKIGYDSEVNNGIEFIPCDKKGNRIDHPDDKLIGIDGNSYYLVDMKELSIINPTVEFTSDYYPSINDSQQPCMTMDNTGLFIIAKTDKEEYYRNDTINCSIVLHTGGYNVRARQIQDIEAFNVNSLGRDELEPTSGDKDRDLINLTFFPEHNGFVNINPGKWECEISDAGGKTFKYYVKTINGEARTLPLWREEIGEGIYIEYSYPLIMNEPAKFDVVLTSDKRIDDCKFNCDLSALGVHPGFSMVTGSQSRVGDKVVYEKRYRNTIIPKKSGVFRITSPSYTSGGSTKVLKGFEMTVNSEFAF